MTPFQATCQQLVDAWLALVHLQRIEASEKTIRHQSAVFDSLSRQLRAEKARLTHVPA